MSTGPLPALDSSVADLFLMLKQRDLNTALRAGLARLLEAAGAEGGTLCFAIAERSITLRMGHIPTPAMGMVEQWERALLSRLSQGPLFAEITNQAALGDGRTLLKLPITGPDTVVGNCTLVLPPRHSLTETKYAQVRTLANITGNIASLLQDLSQTQTRLERLGLLYEIGQALGSTLDLPQLLRDTMQLAQDVMHAHASSLMLIDRETGELVIEIVHGSKRDQLRRLRIPMNQGIAGWVATNGQPIIVNDPDSDPRFTRNVDLRTGFMTRNILCVPLQIKGQTIGVLQVLNKQSDEGFDDEDLELMRTLASQAAVAIENARLYRNVREDRDKIIQAQEDVRRELARNLHDGTVQLLSALSMSIEHLRTLMKRAPEMVDGELDSMSAIIQRAIRETRTLLFELRPVVLETQGLAAAFQSYVERLNEAGPGTKVRLVIPPDLMRLPAKVERTLFAIVQEAVNNARKHAEASFIEVKLTPTEDYLDLIIHDDGKGFDIQKMQERYDQSGSLGMINMRERAELVEAELSMESSRGHGTKITVRFPLTRLQPTETL
jgi:signal transduction histidine kinase